MQDNPSPRLVDQRLRNRVIEAVDTLAKGECGVRQVWPDEYFEQFYDQIPHHKDGEMRANSAITLEERSLLLKISQILDQACDVTPKRMTADELIDTGWPKRIQAVAQRALTFLLERGRFSEDREEEEPSLK
jgi:hypothetical protein